MLNPEKRTKKTNFIYCMISTTILSLGFGSILMLGNFNVYIVSYIHDQKGQEFVNLQYGNLMVPLLTFAMTCFTPISGPLEKKFGPKLTIILGEIIIAIFLILFYIQKNIWFSYFICFGIGLGYSIIQLIPVKNLCFYYPKHKGVISASIPGIGIISSAIFNIIGEKIINPDGKTTVNGFFSKEINDNSKILFLYILIVNIICTTISLIFFVQYNPKFESSENINCLNEIDEKIIKDDDYYKNLKKIIKNYRIWNIGIFGAFAGFSVGFVLTTSRTFLSLTQTGEDDGKIIQYLGAFIVLCLCVFAPIWAILSDKIGFRKAIVIVTFLGILDSTGLIFFLNEKIMYRILICIAGIILSGIIAVIGPHVMGVFGIKYSLELNGITGIFSGITSLGGAITSFVFGIIWDKAEDIIFPYKIVFIIGSVMSILAFILQWFEPEEEFDFGDMKKIDEEKCEDKEDNML